MPDEVYGNTGAQDVREFPNAVDVERQVLGVMMLSKAAIAMASVRLVPESFYYSAHREIWVAIQHLYRSDSGVDAVTLIERLRATDKLERARGEDYIRKLVSQIATTANMEDHVAIVEGHATRRSLIKLADGLSKQCYDLDVDVSDIVQGVRQALSGASTGARSRSVGIDEIVMEIVDEMDAISNGTWVNNALSTGFPTLDNMLIDGGIAPGALWVIPAPTSHGKTALSYTVALHWAADLGVPVVVAAYESSPRTTTNRFMIMHSCNTTPHDGLRVTSTVYRNRRHKGADRERAWIMVAAQAMFELPIRCIKANPDVDLLADDLRTLAAEGQCKAAVVDFLQIVPVKGKRSTEENLSHAMTVLKAVAEDLEIPIIIPVQFNRQASFDNRIRPRLSLIKGASAIEQAADLATVLWRPAHDGDQQAGETAKTATVIYHGSDRTFYQNEAVLSIDKQREGEPGLDIELLFSGESGLYRERGDRNEEEML